MRMPTDKKKTIALRKINSARGIGRFFSDRRSPRSESHSRYSLKWPCLADVALAPPKGQALTFGDVLAEACQRSPSSYDDGAADGTAGLTGIKVRALVGGEAASSISVPARSADNG